LSINNRKSERIAMLEAALYAAGRPVNISDLMNVIRTKSEKVIKSLLQDLAIKYEVRKSALEVRHLPDGLAVMRLKEQYDETVKRFTNRPLLTSGPLKTLSYIAYHHPVEQTQIIADRGNHVYSHLKKMEEMGLITREKVNGSYLVETTPYFSEYFGFGQDPMKSKIQLRRIFNDLKIKKLENGEEDNTSSGLLKNIFEKTPISNFDGYP